MPKFQPSVLPTGAYRVNNKNHDYWIADNDGNVIGQTGANGQDTFFVTKTTDALFLVTGDSWASRNFNASGVSLALPDYGIVNWANALSNNRLVLGNQNAAVGGSTSATWLSLLGSALSGITPGWVSAHIGINDIASDVAAGAVGTAGSIIDNLYQGYEKIRGVGARLVCCTIGPFGSTYTTAGSALLAKNLNRLVVNEWIRNYAATHSNCVLLDQHAILTDATDVTGDLVAAYNDTTGTSGLHINAAGARAVGAALATIIRQYTVDNALHASGYIDSYDYDTTCTNRVSNPMMLSTGGGNTPGAGTTITATTIPTSWNVVTAAGGTSTTVCTTEARTVANDGDAIGQNQKLVISGTNATDQVSLRTGSISSRFTTGDRIFAECCVRIESATALEGLRLLATYTSDAVPYNMTGLSTQSTGFDGTDGVIWIRTPEYTVAAGSKSSTLLTLDALFNGAGGATLHAGRFQWRKVVNS